jgi:hypothetical protein
VAALEALLSDLPKQGKLAHHKEDQEQKEDVDPDADVLLSRGPNLSRVPGGRSDHVHG